MLRLINRRGWEAILPDALGDKELLLVSDQLRDLLSGVEWDENRDAARAALPLTLLLLNKAGVACRGSMLDVELETLQEALYLLSAAVDREIVNRMLHRTSSSPIGKELLQGFKALVQQVGDDAKAPCPA